MAETTNRRSKTILVKMAAVDHAGAFLQTLPAKPKEDMSLREAVDRLRDELRAALAKGYSYDDLAAMLTQKGIEISASTLKNYVPSGKRQAAKEKQAAVTKPRGRRSKKTEENGAAAISSEEPTTGLGAATVQSLSMLDSLPDANGSEASQDSDEAENDTSTETTPAPAKRRGGARTAAKASNNSSSAAKKSSPSRSKSSSSSTKSSTSNRRGGRKKAES